MWQQPPSLLTQHQLPVIHSFISSFVQLLSSVLPFFSTFCHSNSSNNIPETYTLLSRVSATMKVSIIVASVAQVASAHYFFNTNIINGVTTSANKYIMASTRATAYNPIKFSSNPAADIRDGSYVDGPDIRCNQGAFTNSGKTEVMTVAAGSEVRFKLGVGATMAHPGT